MIKFLEIINLDSKIMRRYELGHDIYDLREIELTDYVDEHENYSARIV